MRRMWAAGAAVLVCLALGAMPVLAQEHTLVIGTQECPTFVEGTTTVVGGVEQSRGYEFGCTLAMDDPRVSGDLTAHGDSDCLVPNQQSQIFHEALQAAGATSTFNLVAGAGHGDQAITTSQTPVALEMLKSVFGK